MIADYNWTVVDYTRINTLIFERKLINVFCTPTNDSNVNYIECNECFRIIGIHIGEPDTSLLFTKNVLIDYSIS